MPFTPFEGPYSNHCDVTLNPGNGIAEITVTYRANNQGAYRCQLWELSPPYTGVPIIKRDWAQGPDYGVLGPFGYGASQVLPNGSLLVVIPAGLESANSVTPTILIEPNFAAPYPLGGGSSTDPRVDALVSQVAALTVRVTNLEVAIGGEKGTALTPEQARVLDYLVSVVGPLINP